MRVVIQRTKSASVSIDGKINGEISKGLLILLGIEPSDTTDDASWLVKKAAMLRVFDDDEGVMNKSVIDIDGEVMVVSQFTLMASYKKGNRPSYIHAAGPEIAIPLYEFFCKEMEETIKKPVKTGVFGANMQVGLVNDGPVTICMDSKRKE